MFKTLCVFLIFAVVANAYVYSGSSNTGLNSMSSGSSVVQNDIQNAQALGGYGGHAYANPAYGYGYGYGYGYPYYAGYYGYPGYGYGRYPYYM